MHARPYSKLATTSSKRELYTLATLLLTGLKCLDVITYKPEKNNKFLKFKRRFTNLAMTLLAFNYLLYSKNYFNNRHFFLPKCL